MNDRSNAHVLRAAPMRTRRRALRASRDPALWVWLVVALLALLPLRSALTAATGVRELAGDAQRQEMPASVPFAERPASAAKETPRSEQRG